MKFRTVAVLVLVVCLVSGGVAGQQQAPTMSLNEGSLPLEAADNQVLTGETNLEPGTEIEVSFRSETSSDPFLLRESTQVNSDGSFEVVVDLSDYDVGSEYDIIVRFDRNTLLEQQETLAQPGSTTTATPSPEPTPTSGSASTDASSEASAASTGATAGVGQQATDPSDSSGPFGMAPLAAGGAVVGVLGIVGVVLWRRRESGDDGSASTSEADLETADQALADARSARSDGEYSRAIERFEAAITHYMAAADDPPVDEDQRQAIEESLESARAGLAAVEQHQEAIETLETAVSEAESALQTALTAHADGQTTVAQSRYQQACTAYERALDALDDANEDPLKDGLTVAWDTETTSPPDNIAAVPAVGDGKTVAGVGLATRDDYDDATDGELDTLADVQRTLATAWWESDATETFTSRREIQERLNVARQAIEEL